MLGNLTEHRVGDDCYFLDLSVVITNESEVTNCRCQICPPWEVYYIYQQTVKPAGSFNEITLLTESESRKLFTVKKTC